MELAWININVSIMKRSLLKTGEYYRSCKKLKQSSGSTGETDPVRQEVKSHTYIRARHDVQEAFH